MQFIITHGNQWVVDVEAGRRTHWLGDFATLALAIEHVERWSASRGLELQSVVLLEASRRYQLRR